MRIYTALALLCAIGMLVMPMSWAEEDGATAKRPNVLLVVADDLGYTDLGCFGSEIRTPNIDTLAKQGVLFTDHHASMSCSPTRSMLLSGTDNHIAGIGNMGELLTENQKGKPGYEGYLNDRVVSVAEVLGGAGYFTCMAGKWHLGGQADRIPHARGFERSFSMLDGGSSYWHDRIGLLAGHPFANYVEDDRTIEELPRDFYSTRNFTDYLIEALRANRESGRPFFAYLAFNAPHDPMHVPEPWLSQYRGRYDQGYEVLKAERGAAARELGLVAKDTPQPARHWKLEPWSEIGEEDRRQEVRGMEAYAGMVSNMDYHFGRMIAFLKDIGELDNTIILFMSDNGANPWYSERYPGNEGSEWFEQFDNSPENIGHPGSNYAYGPGWGLAGSGPFSLAKLTVGEGGIRTPLIVSGPGVKGGRKVTAFTYVWDIMPTVLGYVGVEHPETYEGRKVERMRGRSLKGLLDGTKQRLYGPDEYVAGELSDGKWIRRGNLKASVVLPPVGTGKWELFDLEKDPGETQNLAEEQPEALKEMIAAWDAYAEEVGVVPMEAE